MKKTCMTAMLTVLVLSSLPAMAAETADTQNSAPASSGSSLLDSIKRGLSNADARISEHLRGHSSTGRAEKKEAVKIHQNTTAQDLLGKDVYDAFGNKIARLKDIIIDSQGQSKKIALSECYVFGYCKRPAFFDYKHVVSQPGGKIVTDLTKKDIETAKKPSTTLSGTLLSPGDYSLAKMMKDGLADAKGQKIAAIENIRFVDGKVTQVVVGFDHSDIFDDGSLLSFDYNTLSKSRQRDSLALYLPNAKTAFNQ